MGLQAGDHIHVSSRYIRVFTSELQMNCTAFYHTAVSYSKFTNMGWKGEGRGEIISNILPQRGDYSRIGS